MSQKIITLMLKFIKNVYPVKKTDDIYIFFFRHRNKTISHQYILNIIIVILNISIKGFLYSWRYIQRL